MRTSKPPLPQLRQDLTDIDRIIAILERAQRELSLVIDLDEGIRKNPLRRLQLDSITARLNSERRKRASIARTIQKIEP